MTSNQLGASTILQTRPNSLGKNRCKFISLTFFFIFSIHFHFFFYQILICLLFGFCLLSAMTQIMAWLGHCSSDGVDNPPCLLSSNECKRTAFVFSIPNSTQRVVRTFAPSASLSWKDITEISVSFIPPPPIVVTYEAGLVQRNCLTDVFFFLLFHGLFAGGEPKFKKFEMSLFPSIFSVLFFFCWVVCSQSW